MGTKGSVAGAIGGFSEGFGRGFSMMSDVQTRKLAERRAGRMEAMEREKFDFLKGTTEAEGARAATLFEETRKKTGLDETIRLAHESIGPNFSSSPQEEKKLVFERLLAPIQRKDATPEETVRNATLVTSIMKEIERAKRQALDLEREKLEMGKTAKEGKPEGLKGEALIKGAMWKSVAEDTAKAAKLSDELGFSTTGPFQGRLTNVKAFFNQADPKALELRQILNRVKGTISRAQAGTSFTLGEQKLVDSYTATANSPDLDLAVRLKETERGAKEFLKSNYELSGVPIPPDVAEFLSGSPVSSQPIEKDPLDLRSIDFGSGQP